MKPSSTGGLVACLCIGLTALVGVGGVLAWGGGGSPSAPTTPAGSGGPAGADSAGGFGGFDSGGRASSRAVPSPSPANPPSAGTSPVTGSDLKGDFPAPPGATVAVPSQAVPGAQAWTTALDPEPVESFYRRALSARHYTLDLGAVRQDAPDNIFATIYAVTDTAGKQVGVMTITNRLDGSPTAVEWRPT